MTTATNATEIEAAAFALSTVTAEMKTGPLAWLFEEYEVGGVMNTAADRAARNAYRDKQYGEPRIQAPVTTEAIYQTIDTARIPNWEHDSE